MTPDGRTVYVVNSWHPGSVISIRTATNKALKAIKVGIGSDLIVITP